MTEAGGPTIVFAVPDYAPAVGGTNRHVALLAQALAARHRDVLVLTRRRQRSWPRRETVSQVRVERLGLPGWSRWREQHGLLALALRLRALRRRSPIVCAVMWPDAGLAAAAGRVSRRTVVLWAIRGEADDALAPSGTGRQLIVALRRAVLRRCAHVVLTATMAEELARYGIESAVVPVPVDLDAFRPPTADERATSRDRIGLGTEFAVVYVGHLQRRKAVDRLVAAVAILHREGLAVRLLVVGGGRGAPDDTEDELRAQVRFEGLDEVVRFYGVAPDPRPYLWAADAFALPSFREGMPNSLLEAMACGVPCVAPASAGGDELLDDGAGVVPASNGPGELADAIRRLAQDDDLRRSLAEHAGRRVSSFGVDAVVAQLERAFDDAVRPR